MIAKNYQGYLRLNNRSLLQTGNGMKKYFLSLSVIINLFLLTPVFAAEKMIIAILDLQPKGGVTANISGALSDMLRAEMVKTDLFRVVERNQMAAILREQGFQQTGCTDADCAVQIGKLLSAKKMLTGEINLMGGIYITTVRIVDVEKGLAEFAETDQAASINTLARSAENLARKLADRIGGGSIFSGLFSGHPVVVTLSPQFLMPLGNFSNIVSSAYGGLVGVSFDNVIFTGFRPGVSAGFWNYTGSKVSTFYMVPVLATACYSIHLWRSFALVPELYAGGEYASAKYTNNKNSAVTKSAFEPLAMAGLLIEYGFTDRIAVQAGADYGMIFESSGVVSFIAFKAGILYRFL